MALAQAEEWEPLREVSDDRHIDIDTDAEAATATGAVRDALDARLRESAANYAAGGWTAPDGTPAGAPYGPSMPNVPTPR